MYSAAKHVIKAVAPAGLESLCLSASKCDSYTPNTTQRCALWRFDNVRKEHQSMV